MKKILHGLKGLRIVGADVVEVIESYDGPAQVSGQRRSFRWVRFG